MVERDVTKMKTQPTPRDADVMPVAQFARACEDGAFIDEDGHGFFCVNPGTMTDVPAVPSRIVNMPKSELLGYVAWFSK